MSWWKTGGRNQGKAFAQGSRGAAGLPSQSSIAQIMKAQADAQAQIAFARHAMGLDRAARARHPDYDDTFGWRSWYWDLNARLLISPHMGTVWNGPELRCDSWNEGNAVRGEAGIHALFVPPDWATRVGPSDNYGGSAFVSPDGNGGFSARVGVTGVVERFGKYVLGTDGWRAEWVMIRKLKAPTEEIGMELEQAFPDVEVVYGNR